MQHRHEMNNESPQPSKSTAFAGKLWDVGRWLIVVGCWWIISVVCVPDAVVPEQGVGSIILVHAG